MNKALVLIAALIVTASVVFAGPYMNDRVNGIRSILIPLDGERDFQVTYAYKEPAGVVLSFYSEHTDLVTGKVVQDGLHTVYLTPEDARNMAMAMRIVLDLNHPLESN